MDSVTLLNQPAPDFELADLQDRKFRLSKRQPGILILNFWSAECPWSERADGLLLEWLAGWGLPVSLWTVAANANEPREMVSVVAGQRGLPVVLLDTHQAVANLYQAQTTPHAFVIDQAGLLRYQGAVDDVTFRQRTPTRYYLREAVEALLAGRQPQPQETPPYGCTVVRYAG
jgi:hypothetical protein